MFGGHCYTLIIIIIIVCQNRVVYTLTPTTIHDAPGRRVHHSPRQMKSFFIPFSRIIMSGKDSIVVIDLASSPEECDKKVVSKEFPSHSPLTNGWGSSQEERRETTDTPLQRNRPNEIISLLDDSPQHILLPCTSKSGNSGFTG